MAERETIRTKGAWHFSLVKDVDETVRRFWEDLGIGPWQIMTIDDPRIRARVYGQSVPIAVKAGITQVGSLVMGIDQCLVEPNPYEEILRKRGGGAHHLAFLVDDLERAERQMERLGYTTILSGHGIGVDADGGGSYFDTVEAFGTVIELSQLPREMPPFEAAYPPPGAAPRPTGVGIRDAVHLALAVRDAEATARRYEEELGVGPWRIETFGSGAGRAIYRGKPCAAELKVAYVDLGPFVLALEEPLTEPSHIQEFLDRNGQGIHHVCFAVDELAPAAEEMRRLGYEEIISVQGFGPNGDGEAAHFDTEGALGVIVELAKVPTGM